MGIIYIFIILSVISISEQKTRITILYEALCPDSEVTISNLHENYHSNKDEVDLEFVPYGKASHTHINGSWKFECQHDDEECELNKYHACGLKYTNSQTNQLNFVNCMLKNVADLVEQDRTKTVVCHK